MILMRLFFCEVDLISGPFQSRGIVMIRKLVMTVLLCLLLSAQVAFGDKVKDDDTEDIGVITIEDESEAIALTHSSLPVTVIEMDKYHGRNISLNEVLKRVAGVKIKQEGGLGSNATIAIQGLEGKRVKIFLDGSPLNSPDGTFGINDLPVQLIERIEVYKGVVPAKFGGDALGGAVNVVTREFVGNYVDLTGSFGSYNTYRSTVVLKKKFFDDTVEWGVGGFYNEAANDYVMESPYVEGLKIKRGHDFYRSYILATAGKIKDRWFDEIEIELAHYESLKEIQGIKSAVYKAESKSNFNVAVFSFEKERFLSDRLAFDYDIAMVDLTLNYIDKATDCYDFNGNPRACGGSGGETGSIPHDSDDKQWDLRHDLNLNYTLTPAYALNFHLNSQYSEYKPSDELASTVLGYDVGAFPSEKTNTVLSFGLESSHFGKAVVNDMGVKSYLYDYKITSQERFMSSTPKQSKNDGKEFGYYESMRYMPVKDFFIKASYEHAFRLPNSGEVFGDGVSITPSPGLEPEEADNVNIGFLYDTYDVFGLSWLKLETNVFYRDIRNMIKLESDSHTTGYVNLGQVEAMGFELDAQADLTENWYLYANYTNQTLKDKQKIVGGTVSTSNPTYDLDLPNVPRQYGNIGLEYKMLGLVMPDSLFKVFWETNWCDEYYYGWEMSVNQDRKIDEQITHTAGCEYSFNDDRFIIGFEVRNLADEVVTDVFNYPLMGRTYHLNVRYSWFEK